MVDDLATLDRLGVEWLYIDHGQDAMEWSTHCEWGTVGSKRAAPLWATENLDPQWRGLIQRTLDERHRGFDVTDSSTPGSVEMTVRFAECAKERSRSAKRSSRQS